MMYSILLFLAFVAAANALHCVSCGEINCVGGTCRNDEDGCGQCTGRVLTPKPKPPRGGIFGPCVEECYSGPNPDLQQRRGCEKGFECRSNGCGHVCRKINTPKPKPQTRGRFGTCVEECDSGLYPDLQLPRCEDGKECRSNGCGHTCQDINSAALSSRSLGTRVTSGICVEECDSGLNSDLQLPRCKDGYECRSNGCGHVCKEINPRKPKPQTRGRFGTCVEECDSGLNSDLQLPRCKDDEECRSNGCGHTCQKINSAALTDGPLGTRVTSGICVEECDSGLNLDLQLPRCKDGYECVSNGCGHVCKEIDNSQQTPVGHCAELCGSGCPKGSECVSNGCGHICQQVTDSQQTPVGHCAELCGSGCPKGSECVSNGCGHICQQVTEEPTFGHCAELCGEGCPAGKRCLSNGCGHSCQ